MKRIVMAVALGMAVGGAAGQAQVGAAGADADIRQEMRAMRAMQSRMQAEIDELRRQIADRDGRGSGVGSAPVAVTPTGTSSSVVDQDGRVKEVAGKIDARQAEVEAETHVAMRYKGLEITPVGFVAAESVYRSKALNADVSTPLNLTPFPGAGEAHTSELNFSGRHSRFGALVEGSLPFAKVAAYFEADFLSAGVTSNDNQSNSYTLRQRQAFGQVAFARGLTVTGGQMWSLVTETGRGTDARTEVLPQTTDAAYNAGFSWARQPGIRVQQKLGLATYAVALEEAQTIFAASNQNQNFFLGSAGVAAGLYNVNANYSNDVAPDVIVKAAFDPAFGHFEVGGIARFFRDRRYPGVVSATPVAAVNGVNDMEVGGGFFANARLPVTRYFTLGVHVLQGTGVGRYGTATLPDVTVHPDGRLAPIRSSQGLLSLEFHPTRKLDLNGYAGGEYAQRTVYLDPVSGKMVGYAPVTNDNAGCKTETTPVGSTGYLPGVALNCAGNTRALLEGSAGFVYRFYEGPKGRLQYGVTYGYLNRAAWTGTIGTGFGAPKGTNNMVFTSFRYYIP